MIKDYYHLFGLPRGAPLSEIKSAYHKLAAQYHPDKVMGLGSELQQMAQAKMLELNEAMAMFEDPARRAQYDEMLELIPERKPGPPRAAAPPPPPPPPAPDAVETASGPEPRPAPASPAAPPAPEPSAGRELWLDQEGRELKSGLRELPMKWQESAVRGWQWVIESGDWRRTLVVAHRQVESLSLLSVRGFLAALEGLVGKRKLTTRATTIIAVVTYQNLMDAQIVRAQLQEAVGGTRGLFKTVTPLIVLHDDKMRRTALLGNPTEYPETRRVLRYLLAPRSD